MRKFVVINTYVILTLALCFIIYSFVTHVTPAPIEDDVQTGTAVPAISLKDAATSELTTIDFSKKPTVLLFFTSWCPYCNEDAPKIVQLEAKYKDKIQFYGINLLYRDDREELGDGFPSLYFYKTDGNLIDSIIGSTAIADIDFAFNYLHNVN
ncbi:TlpA disulfide reductase family protein [Paenibacillus sp. OV219]|uniref:TlpA family protein disulfide reductase n=1 Tax=Paenibacillus sp. OV219 TaxID=1884377 RepID=UPI0008BEC982|nr:TlpA disulfide reductase family protein [Paenibacillus sp. OV219]SEM58961.1 Thiol-disulfide isomerase or thioredoxin [Paenibacillus sp. OV219]